ncbi:DMT family transporter [Salinithrix halophila]|uniref:DMT family transporter n=1 Tax=Salinithrix halophila TaxID=1485204 RepID=A0ABV8JD08_9BACL
MSNLLKMVLVAMFWAGLYPIGHHATETMHPIAVAFYRFLFTTLCLMPILFWKERHTWKIQKNEWVPLLLLGMTGIFSYNSFFFMGLQSAGAVKSAVIIAAIPMVTTVFTRLLYKDRLTVRQIIGVILSFSGVICVVTEGNLQGITQVNTGDIWLLGAVLTFSIYTLLGKRFMASMSPLKTTTYATFFGTIYFAFTVIWVRPPSIQTFTLGQWSALLYMAIFATVIAFVWWNDGVSTLGPGVTAIFLNLVPVFTFIFSTITGEPFRFMHLLGAVCVVCGVSLTLWFGSKEAKPDSLKPKPSEKNQQPSFTHGSSSI